jgi:hypothetical protein
MLTFAPNLGCIALKDGGFGNGSHCAILRQCRIKGKQDYFALALTDAQIGIRRSLTPLPPTPPGVGITYRRFGLLGITIAA